MDCVSFSAVHNFSCKCLPILWNSCVLSVLSSLIFMREHVVFVFSFSSFFSFYLFISFLLTNRPKTTRFPTFESCPFKCVSRFMFFARRYKTLALITEIFFFNSVLLECKRLHPPRERPIFVVENLLSIPPPFFSFFKRKHPFWKFNISSTTVIYFYSRNAFFSQTCNFYSRLYFIIMLFITCACTRIRSRDWRVVSKWEGREKERKMSRSQTGLKVF